MRKKVWKMNHDAFRMCRNVLYKEMKKEMNEGYHLEGDDLFQILWSEENDKMYFARKKETEQDWQYYLCFKDKVYSDDRNIIYKCWQAICERYYLFKPKCDSVRETIPDDFPSISWVYNRNTQYRQEKEEKKVQKQLITSRNGDPLGSLPKQRRRGFFS